MGIVVGVECRGINIITFSDCSQVVIYGDGVRSRYSISLFSSLPTSTSTSTMPGPNQGLFQSCLGRRQLSTEKQKHSYYLLIHSILGIYCNFPCTSILFYFTKLIKITKTAWKPSLSMSFYLWQFKCVAGCNNSKLSQDSVTFYFLAVIASSIPATDNITTKT